MASGRTLSACRLCSHQHEPPGRTRRCFLQQARNMRAMDQGRQGRDQMDAAVMPHVRGQRCSPSASRAGLQPRQLSAYAGDAGADRGLVDDESEGEAHQDRREGRAPRPLCFLPDGGGRHSQSFVRRHSAAYRGTSTTTRYINRVKRSICYVSEPNSRERRASMRKNSAIFNARHGAGSFHPHRQPAPTAQEGLKIGNGAIWRTTRQLSGECWFKERCVWMTTKSTFSALGAPMSLAWVHGILHVEGSTLSKSVESGKLSLDKVGIRG